MPHHATAAFLDKQQQSTHEHVEHAPPPTQPQHRNRDYELSFCAMNLILIKPSEVQEKHTDNGTCKQVTLTNKDERTIHIRKHLRKKSGDQVSVGIIGGGKGKAIVQLDVDSISLILQHDTFEEDIDLPEITIILALPFPARLKALWPVLSSFHAVPRVVVVKGQLSNEEFCETSALQPQVYEPLIEKGMSQGVRTRPVQIDICVDEFVSKQLLQTLYLLGDDSLPKDGIARLFLDCGDENNIPPPAREVVLQYCTQNKSIVAFGPERGWTEEGANLFVNECGFKSATLGSSILRVDTAVIAGVGIVSAALDELQDQMSASESTKKRKN
jgi:RsmE family RNA methyltransferase